jgi:hypothetical protein
VGGELEHMVQVNYVRYLAWGRREDHASAGVLGREEDLPDHGLEEHQEDHWDEWEDPDQEDQLGEA